MKLKLQFESYIYEILTEVNGNGCHLNIQLFREINGIVCFSFVRLHFLNVNIHFFTFNIY